MLGYAGASTQGERLQWWPFLLHVTQWCFNFTVVQASFTSNPHYRAPHYYPLRLSSHSQQQSPPQVFSPNPIFQYLFPICTGRHTCQAGEHMAVADHLHRSHCPACLRPVAGLSSEPLKLPFCYSNLPTGEGVSPDAGTQPLPQQPPRGTGSIPLPLLFLFLSGFLHSTWLHRDLSCFQVSEVLWQCLAGAYRELFHSQMYSFFFLFFFLMKDNCLTEFCCFLSNLNMNQSQVYIYIPFLLNVLSIFLPSYPSRLIQSPCLSFLNHTANFHWLYILLTVMLLFPNISPSSPLSPCP